MKAYRKYGVAPYKVAVIHGGPGAPGEMAPVAREIASDLGVIEPLQSANTIEGQVIELRGILEKNAMLPCTLVGYSWGAWLSFILAARYPSMVRKLILVSSGPFEEKYARDIMKTRLDRLASEEKKEIHSILEAFNDVGSSNMDEKMARFGQLISKADTYDPIPHDNEVVETQYEILRNVWTEAAELRRTGRLLTLATEINCPVTAIHGDYDPHPAQGVENPLSRSLKGFRFILIKKCGHTPWLEKQARAEFFSILREELKK